MFGPGPVSVGARWAPTNCLTLTHLPRAESLDESLLSSEERERRLDPGGGCRASRSDARKITPDSAAKHWGVTGLPDPMPPTVARASAATGLAHSLDIPNEDTITLTVDWIGIESGNKATAIYYDSSGVASG